MYSFEKQTYASWKLRSKAVYFPMSKCNLALNRTRKVLGSSLGAAWLFWLVWFWCLFFNTVPLCVLWLFWVHSTQSLPSARVHWKQDKVLHAATDLYILEPDLSTFLTVHLWGDKPFPFFWSKEKVFQALKYIPKNKIHWLCSVSINVWRGTHRTPRASKEPSLA